MGLQLRKKKRVNSVRLLFFFIMSVFLMSIILSTPSGQKEGLAQEKAATQVAQLTNADCVKCHPAVTEKIETKGGKHKTAVTCMDCHKGHPPMVSKEEIIPACNDCHMGKPHYEIGKCNSCHSNPHAPLLEMKLAANITDPCLSCHDKEGADLKGNPSAHTKLGCTGCHTFHKEIPECLKCHKPHSAEMVNKDCLSCHPPHKPLVVTYGPDMPSKNCAACHANIYDTLTASKTKHAAFACVFCHKEKHKMIPSCESCHGTPHPAPMLEKFPKCNMCHISAHKLGG
jgi:predicted CXXCH cytochrome family protein